MPELALSIVDPSSANAVGILYEYYDDIVARYHGRPATEAETTSAIADEPSDDLAGESGLFVIAVIGDEVIGCGGIRFVDSAIGELTRIFVRPSGRGMGAGAAIVDELEARARAHGLGRLRLNTRSDLVEARRLYARLGYVEVPAFNNDTYAQHWFAKEL